jgi:hypothetical protein
MYGNVAGEMEKLSFNALICQAVISFFPFKASATTFVSPNSGKSRPVKLVLSLHSPVKINRISVLIKQKAAP